MSVYQASKPLSGSHCRWWVRFPSASATCRSSLAIQGWARLRRLSRDTAADAQRACSADAAEHEPGSGADDAERGGERGQPVAAERSAVPRVDGEGNGADAEDR